MAGQNEGLCQEDVHIAFQARAAFYCSLALGDGSSAELTGPPGARPHALWCAGIPARSAPPSSRVSRLPVPFPIQSHPHAGTRWSRHHGDIPAQQMLMEVPLTALQGFPVHSRVHGRGWPLNAKAGPVEVVSRHSAGQSPANPIKRGGTC